MHVEQIHKELEERYNIKVPSELLNDVFWVINNVAGLKKAQAALDVWGERIQRKNWLAALDNKPKRGRKQKTYNQQEIQAKIDKEIQENIEADAYILDLEMQAENHPDGKKAFWKAEMVGKWSYGLDQHPMTEEEFEEEWKEMSNND